MSRKLLLLTSLVIVLTSLLGLSLEVKEVMASETVYIRADGSIDPLSAPIYSSDNVTYSLTGNISESIFVERDNIVIAGEGYTLQGAGIGNGLNLTDRNNVTIENMRIDGFDMGIYVRNSSNNIISGNRVSDCIQRGIHLYGSSNNNTVSGNTLTNDRGGIGVFLVSSNNIISGNKIKDNIQNGIYLYASSNLYYGNNFINNTLHVSIGGSYSPDFWDNDIEGNYWDNYTGIDSNSDGIGDTPHVIESSIQDNYPLMGKFSDFRATPEHNVQTVSNSSISDFQFNGTAISFNVSGGASTAGFTRISIPTALMDDTYRIFVNGTEVSPTLLPISNSTLSHLYFTYEHSTQEIIIIPEFPSLIALPLFMTAILLAAIAYRRKRLT